MTYSKDISIDFSHINAIICLVTFLHVEIYKNTSTVWFT